MDTSRNEPSRSVRIVEKHARAIRWCHWINFPLIALMIWSGILIYWANEAYVEIPENVATALGLSSRLADGLGWHFLIMWIFAINGAIYVLYLLFSGEWRELFPDRLALKEALQVMAHDLRLRKTAPPLRSKFNGAQKIAYTSVLLLATGSLATGLAIYKPVQLSWLTAVLGGYRLARLEHFVLMCALVGFFFVHIAQVIRAGWNNFRAMVAGYEVVDDDAKQK